MLARFKKLPSPGVVLGTLALIVAVSGSSIAIVQAQNGKQDTLRTRIGGATKQVTQTVTLLPQATNNGISDHTVTCPANAKLGPGVAYSGGVVDTRPPDNTRNLAPLSQQTSGPSGTGAWLFQFDNDSAVELQVQLRVLCTFSKLNTKRG